MYGYEPGLEDVLQLCDPKAIIVLESCQSGEPLTEIISKKFCPPSIFLP